MKVVTAEIIATSYFLSLMSDGYLPAVLCFPPFPGMLALTREIKSRDKLHNRSRLSRLRQMLINTGHAPTQEIVS